MNAQKLRMTALCLGLLSVVTISAQVTLDEAKKYFDVPGGVQNVDKKVLKEPSPQALPYIGLRFRISSAELLSDGKVSAKTYAMLDGIDSTLFQEITNEFQTIFSQKLTAAGVTLVDFAKIKESKGYKSFTEEQSSRNFEHKDYGTAHVYTENNVPFFYYPTGAMKVAKFVGQVEGGAAYLRLTIDFVEFDMAVKYEAYKNTINSKSFPVIKITSEGWAEGGAWTMATTPNRGGGFSMMDHKKYFGASFSQLQPIYEPFDAKVEAYDSKIPKYASKKYGGSTPQLGTFVLEANRDSYKKSALKALTKYADCVAEIIKSYNTK